MFKDKLIEFGTKIKRYFCLLGPVKRIQFLYQQRKFHEQIQLSEGASNSLDAESAKFPIGEKLEFPSFWLIEIYTPSTLKGLIKGLNLINDLGGRRSSLELKQWIENTRIGKTSGWINLGSVYSKPDKSTPYNSSQSPHHSISSITASMTSISSSLLALSFHFAVDDNETNCIQKVLEPEAQPKFRRKGKKPYWQLFRFILLGGSFNPRLSIPSHGMLKKESYETKITEIETKCAVWVASNFPGFYSNCGINKIPRAGLYVTEKSPPFSAEMENMSVFDGIGLNRTFSAWRVKELKNAGVIFTSNDSGIQRMNIGCRRSDFASSEITPSEPSNNNDIRFHIQLLMEKTMVCWSLSLLLDTYHEIISTKRDIASSNGSFSTLRDLKDLRHLAKNTLFDIEITCLEIRRLRKNSYFLYHNTAKLYFIDGVNNNERELLTDHFKTKYKNGSQSVSAEAILLQKMLETVNGLTQTISSVKLQRIVFSVSFLSLVVAITSVFLRT